MVPAILVLAIYAPALRYAFVWDDERLIARTTRCCARPTACLRAMRSDFWLTVGQNASGFWRPLITLSYATDGLLFRWQPWGYHLMNTLSAAGVASLVTLLAMRLRVGRWPALAAGAWFALMPHHVESTAWIAGRTDLYSAFFFLLALWLDRRAADADAKGPGVLALVTFGAALLCKEASLLFVVVSFAWRWTEREERRGAFADALRWTAPYLAVTVVYLALHFWWVPAAPPPQYLSAETLRKGRLAAWAMFPGYLSFLNPFYPHSPAVVVRMPESWRDVLVIAGFVMQVALVGTLAFAARRRSRWGLALLVLWVTLLPTTLANLFQTYLLYSERFMYLPSIGAAWLLAFALGALATRGAAMRWAGAAAAAALVVASAVATARILPDWKDDDTLYRSMTEKQPRNAMGWILLARHRLVKGDEAAAEHALKMLDGLESTRPEMLSVEALLYLALDPTLGEPRLARATALLRMGRMEEAEQAIAQLNVMLPENSTVASLEGQRLLALRRPADALPYLRRAVEYLHDDADLFYALGLAHAMLNQLPPARAAFEECLRVDPALYDGWLRLATACHVMGDFAARDAALAKAESLPESADGRVAQLRARMAVAR
ncbi:MAG: hypothetical protein IPJ04_12635 [Candidatus Eisenbacteria bacterium]|nr:hypothetical protein [Candidatus Eisenbacteria bacterium]